MIARTLAQIDKKWTLKGDIRICRYSNRERTGSRLFGLGPLVQIVLQPLRLTLLQQLPLCLFSPQVLLQQQCFLSFLLQPFLTLLRLRRLKRSM